MDDCSREIVSKWSSVNGKRLTLSEVKIELRKLVERVQDFVLNHERISAAERAKVKQDATASARVIHSS